MDFQEDGKGNLSDIERLLASLPNASWDSQMSFNNADRMLLQKLLRLTHTLQQQDTGSTPTSSTPSPMPGHEVLPSQLHTFASTDVHSTIAQGFDEGLPCDEAYDLNDPWDYAPDSRSSKIGTPSSDGEDTVTSQTRPHAAVEKRYRRTVNTKLQQLHASIPSSGKFSTSSERLGLGSETSDSEQAAKPVVLDKAIQYITHLISTYRGYENDIQRIRRQVRDLLNDEHVHEPCPVHEPTSFTESRGL